MGHATRELRTDRPCAGPKKVGEQHHQRRNRHDYRIVLGPLPDDGGNPNESQKTGQGGKQPARIDWTQAEEKADELNRIFQATVQDRKGLDGTAPVEWDDITKTAQAIIEQWAPEQGSRPKKPYISEAT